jgi:hypothetical protein
MAIEHPALLRQFFLTGQVIDLRHRSAIDVDEEDAAIQDPEAWKVDSTTRGISLPSFSCTRQFWFGDCHARP